MPERELSVSPEVLALLQKLRGYKERHIELGKYMLSPEEAPGIFNLDLLASAVMNRSLNLLLGFCSLIEGRNFLAAAPLLRLQLDNALRFSAAWLVDDPHEFAWRVIQGTHVRNMLDRDGQKMHDGYLVGKLAEENPWVPEVYKQTSGYVHLSEKHVFNAVRPEEDLRFLTKIAEGDEFLPDEIYKEAIFAFKAITDLLFQYVYGWGHTKRHPPKRSAAGGPPAPERPPS